MSKLSRVVTAILGICTVNLLQVYSKERQKAYNLLTMEYIVASEYDVVPCERPLTKCHREEDAAWLQGDMEMYSPANQKKRKRLKNAPAVQVEHLRSKSPLLPSVRYTINRQKADTCRSLHEG